MIIEVAILSFAAVSIIHKGLDVWARERRRSDEARERVLALSTTVLDEPREIPAAIKRELEAWEETKIRLTEVVAQAKAKRGTGTWRSEDELLEKAYHDAVLTLRDHLSTRPTS